MTKVERLKLPSAYWFQEGPGLRNWQFTTSGIKVLNVGNIMPDGSIDLSRTDRHISIEEFEQRYKHFGVDAGDLVMASSGISFEDDGFLRTKIAFVDERHLPLCMNTSTIRFKAIEGVSCLEYLRHWLQSVDFRRQVSRLVTGTAQLNFGPGHLKQMTIGLPSLDEQRRIAGILDAADALRRSQREAIALLDSLPGAIFAEMFAGKSDFPIAKIQDVVVNSRTGPFGSQLLKSEFVETGIPVLGIDNVVTNQFVEETPRFISKEKYKALRRYTVIPGDVLITIMGTCGKCAVVPSGIPTMVNTKHLCCLTPKYEKIDSEYLRAAFLFDEEVHRQLEQQTKGSIMSGLNMGIIKGLSIKLPPISEQKIFSKRLQNVNNLLRNCHGHLLELKTLTASLQSRAFAGLL